MKLGIVFRPGNLWIGAHWSPQNKRLCVTPFPMITVWVTFKGGLTPRQSAARQRWTDRLYADLESTTFLDQIKGNLELKLNLIDDYPRREQEVLARWRERRQSEPNPEDPTTS